MKLSCWQKDLSLALNRTARAAGKATRKDEPPLVGITAHENTVTMETKHRGLTVKTRFPAFIERDGLITMAHQTLHRLVSALGNARVDLEMEEPPNEDMTGVLHLSCGRSHAKMPAETQHEKAPRHYEPTARAKVSQQDLAVALNSVAFSMGNEADQPRLAGVSLRLDSRLATLATTDGNSLTVYRFGRQDHGNDEWETLPNCADLASAAAIMEPGEPLTLESDDTKCLRVTGKDSVVICDSIPGSLPSWEQFVPENPATTASFSVDEMRRAMRTTGAFARASSGIVRVEILGKDDGNAEIRLWTRHDEIGENVEIIPAHGMEGDDVRIAFGCDYLNNLLVNAQDSEIRVELTSETSPAVFRQRDGFIHVLMPRYIRW